MFNKKNKEHRELWNMLQTQKVSLLNQIQGIEFTQDWLEKRNEDLPQGNKMFVNDNGMSFDTISDTSTYEINYKNK